MKAYLVATGTIFTLLVIVHLYRVSIEPSLVRDPWFWLITILAAALAVWAWLLVARSRRA